MSDTISTLAAKLRPHWLRDVANLPPRDEEKFPYRDKPMIAPGTVMDDKGNVKPLQEKPAPGDKPKPKAVK